MNRLIKISGVMAIGLVLAATAFAEGAALLTCVLG